MRFRTWASFALRGHLYSSLFAMFLLFFQSQSIHAQVRNHYTGTILSSDSTLLLTGIHVINLSSKKHTISTAYGRFLLAYNLGDTIEFRHDHWETKSINGKVLKDSIFLTKKNIVLDEIVIARNRPNNALVDLKQIQKEKNKRNGIYYGGRPPIALLNPFGGKPITFIYELLSKSGRQARKMEDQVKNASEQSKVDRIFRVAAIKSITRIDDNDLEDFMEKYRPTSEQVEDWNTYDLHLYIIESFKSYQKEKTNQPK